MLLLLLAAPFSLAAQNQRPPGKSLDKGVFLEGSVYQMNPRQTFESILQDSVDTDIIDPISLDTLKRLKDEAQPPYNPLDYDPERTRKIAEKALSIQTSQTLVRTLKGSELQPLLRYAKRSMDLARDYFRYSLQDDGDGLTVSKKPKGKKLIELNMEFNASTGMDPQLRLGQSWRLRYDFVESTPLLEFRAQF
jgi:hypothetical protein